MVTSFLQALLRSFVFTSAVILAAIEVVLLLRNNASPSHFDAENCGGVVAVLSSCSIVKDNIPSVLCNNLGNVILSCQMYCFVVGSYGFFVYVTVKWESSFPPFFLSAARQMLLILLTLRLLFNHGEILSVDRVLTFSGAAVFKGDDKVLLRNFNHAI